MKYPKLRQILSLITCVLMMLGVAINQNQKILGHELKEQNETQEIPTITNRSNGITVINTTNIAKDIKGYGGPVPLEIYLKDDKISDIVILKNSETPDFLKIIEEKNMLGQWKELKVDDAISKKVDGITGATLTSVAIERGIQKGLKYSKTANIESATSSDGILSVKFIITLLVIFAAILIPSFIKNSKYRLIQLILNILILGFWSGSFISYSLMVNYLSNGVDIISSIIPLLMLVIAFIFPLFGKKSHYCNWVCPLGSLQEVAGKCSKTKFKLNNSSIKYLN